MSIPAFKINSGSIDAPAGKAYPDNRSVIEQSEGRSESDEVAQGNGGNMGDDESGGDDGAGYQAPVK